MVQGSQEHRRQAITLGWGPSLPLLHVKASAKRSQSWHAGSTPMATRADLDSDDEGESVIHIEGPGAYACRVILLDLVNLHPL